MAERETLLELAERCEKAEGPDRELDREIYRVRFTTIVNDETFIYGPKHGTREITYRKPVITLFAAHYTRDFDHAIDVIDKAKGHFLSGLCDLYDGWRAIVASDKAHKVETVGLGTSPARAICAAAIRARASTSLRSGE